MANYVAHHRKKLGTLARKKLDLIRLLEHHATEQEVAMAAEAVREAQIRALEIKRAQIPACETAGIAQAARRPCAGVPLPPGRDCAEHARENLSGT